MSHAQTNQQYDASSSLVSGNLLIWMYTANAATVSDRKIANLSAWLIASDQSHAQTNQQYDASSSLVSGNLPR